MKRNLDGLYFRVQRNGKWENVCFSDLTVEEIEEVSKDRDANWWKQVALHLKERLNDIGEQFDIVAEDDE